MPTLQDLQRSVEEMTGRATVEGRSADGKVLAMINAELERIDTLTAEVSELEAACAAYATAIETLQQTLITRGHNPADIFDDQGQLVPAKLKAALVDMTVTTPSQPRPKT